MSILNINDLALQLVALDFSDGHMPNNGGPTKTSRALAIIHLAAHDAYALVSGGTLKSILVPTKIPNLPATLVKNAANGSAAMLCAGIRAATVLYPDFKKFIAAESAKFSSSNEDGCCNDLACKYGELPMPGLHLESMMAPQHHNSTPSTTKLPDIIVPIRLILNSRHWDAIGAW
jgi:hypothetical protein